MVKILNNAVHRSLSYAGIVLMRGLAKLPLAWTRALGTALGWALYALVRSRRKVVLTNLAVCFPERAPRERQALARQTFVYFAKAWLDRAWLWHARPECVARQVTLTGALHELSGHAPTVIFLPHFVGLDAAWAAVALCSPRLSTTIYTQQSNPLVNAWMLQGRQRFGNLRLFGRADGVTAIVRALRAGQPLYLLPDMDFGPDDSYFVPFYGLPTATVPSLSRFAKLGQAKVVPLLPRMTETGYVIEILPAWHNFPSHDPAADTARMNQELQRYIDTMPAQYYWVHKRFKTRPAGAAAVY